VVPLKLSRIEFIHGNALIHRDIKPSNFVMGALDSSAANMVNVIDFGLAKRFRDAKTREHVAYKQDEGHGVGTSLFAALNTHMGIECSRRDDIESLAYMLVYFLKGSLPWRRCKGTTVSETWDLIREKKLATESTLTDGLPPEFAILYTYARDLAFDDLPDYEGLRNLFRGLAARKGIKYDGIFDWTVNRRPVRRRGCQACSCSKR
jgi:casein kinase I homolog HRR25